jgi:predicted TIM-barrel enzyme
VFNVEEAVAMAEAGADVLVPHMGLTTKGAIGAGSAFSLEEAARRVQEMHDAVKAIRADIIVLCHGGPIAEPEDAQYIFDHTTGIAGFFGASSVERLPVEVGIRQQAEKFKGLQPR